MPSCNNTVQFLIISFIFESFRDFFVNDLSIYLFIFQALFSVNFKFNSNLRMYIYGRQLWNQSMKNWGKKKNE